jgi:hypothetical protein
MYLSHIFPMYPTDPKNPPVPPASIRNKKVFCHPWTRIPVNHEEYFSSLFQIMFQNMIFGTKFIIRHSKIPGRETRDQVCNHPSSPALLVSKKIDSPRELV